MLRKGNCIFRVKGMRDLPTIPVLLGKIVSVVQDEGSSTQDLYKVISHDQALAERVLRVTNSVFFGHSGEIKDIGQAIALRGIVSLGIITKIGV